MLISLTITGDTPSSISVLTLMRADTGTTPAGVSLPHAMTLANGAWTYSFTDRQSPSTGYNYTYQLNWSDGSSDPGSGFLPAATVTGTAAGYYASQSDLGNKYDLMNISIWSNKSGQATADSNGNPTPNETAVQYALTLADDEINRFFDGSGFIVPLSPVGPLITDWAVTIAAYILYTARGIRDEKVGGDLKAGYTAAYTSMAQYRSGALRLNCGRRWPTPTAPVGI